MDELVFNLQNYIHNIERTKKQENKNISPFDKELQDFYRQKEGILLELHIR